MIFLNTLMNWSVLAQFKRNLDSRKPNLPDTQIAQIQRCPKSQSSKFKRFGVVTSFMSKDAQWLPLSNNEKQTLITIYVTELCDKQSPLFHLEMDNNARIDFDVIICFLLIMN